MCGRFTQAKAAREYMRDLMDEWNREVTEMRPATWNLAPTALSWTIRQIESSPTPTLLRWGFGMKEGETGGFAPINARVETAATKYPFKTSWKEKRCIVPADGWYEWKTEGGGKQPYYFKRADGNTSFFAGIWTDNSFALFTTAADGHLTQVHDRKPLSLEMENALRWIGEGMATADDLINVAVKADSISLHPVGKAVSNWRNNHAELINPL